MFIPFKSILEAHFIDSFLSEHKNLLKYLSTHSTQASGITAIIATLLQLCGDPRCASISALFMVLTVALIHKGGLPSDQENKNAALLAEVQSHVDTIKAAIPDAEAVAKIVVGILEQKKGN